MTQSFALEMDSRSAKNGWMNCWLVVDGQRHHLDATSVFPPFGEVLNFAHALAANILPHEFFWEEEGHGAKFQALPLESGESSFRLVINHDGEIVVDAQFDRKQIMHGLLESLRRVALDCPGADSEWEFPYFLIEDFERGLTDGFNKTSTEGSVDVAHFVFNHYGGYGGTETPSFSIWVGNHHVLFMAMDDIAHFWHEWFDLLGKVQRSDLPAEAIFKRETGDGPEFFSLLGRGTSFHFHIDRSTEPHLFRLQIVSQSSIPEPDAHHTVLDTVLDRRQFVNEFVRSFKEFLQTDYAAYLNSGETQFDLRLLPIDGLTS
jgi:hypothetical protein